MSLFSRSPASRATAPACPACGRPRRNGTRFCGGCGADCGTVTPAGVTPADAPSPPPAPAGDVPWGWDLPGLAAGGEPPPAPLAARAGVNSPALDLSRRPDGLAGMTARILSTQAHAAEAGAAPAVICHLEVDNAGEAVWRWVEVVAFLLTAEGQPLAECRYLQETCIPPSERYRGQARFALPPGSAGAAGRGDAQLAQVVVQVTAGDVVRRGVAEMPLPPPGATRALRLPTLPPGLRAVGGQLVLRPVAWGGSAGPAALEACLLLQNVAEQRLPWVRLTLQPQPTVDKEEHALVAPISGDRAFDSGEVGLLRASGFPAAIGEGKRAWRAILETACPVARCVRHEAVMIDGSGLVAAGPGRGHVVAGPAADALVPGPRAPLRLVTAAEALGWEVRLLNEPAVRRTRGRELPSLFVLVLGLEPGQSVREALAAAWFGERSWHCPLPPGAGIAGEMLPAAAMADDGRVSYGSLQTHGDPATVLEPLFPYLDSVFKVDPATRRIEELELYESSIRFFMKFDLLAKSKQHCLELIEFTAD